MKVITAVGPGWERSCCIWLAPDLVNRVVGMSQTSLCDSLVTMALQQPISRSRSSCIEFSSLAGVACRKRTEPPGPAGMDLLASRSRQFFKAGEYGTMRLSTHVLLTTILQVIRGQQIAPEPAPVQTNKSFKPGQERVHLHTAKARKRKSSQVSQCYTNATPTPALICRGLDSSFVSYVAQVSQINVA